MDFFVILVNEKKQLTNIPERPILNVAGVLDLLLLWVKEQSE